MIFEITRKLFQEVTFYKTNILALYYRTGIKRHQKAFRLPTFMDGINNKSRNNNTKCNNNEI